MMKNQEIKEKAARFRELMSEQALMRERRDADIAKMRFDENKPLQEIAEKHGLTRQRVGQILAQF